MILNDISSNKFVVDFFFIPIWIYKFSTPTLKEMTGIRMTGNVFWVDEKCVLVESLYVGQNYLVVF